MHKRALESIKKWEKEPIKIGITGPSAVGKSFFINAIRGMEDPDDPDYAAVGTGDTTRKPKMYKHPNQPNFEYWDLPGAGTPLFPKETYCKEVNVSEYDFFLIFFSTTISEENIWLANELRKREKKFAFVRTKIDELQYQFTKKPHLIPGEIKKAKEKYLKTLKDASIEVPQVYAISSVKPELGDFNALVQDIGNSFQGLKKTAFLMSIKLLTEEVIQQKKEMLLKETWKYAAISGGIAALPIPGLDVAVNIGVLVVAVNTYLRAFNLEEARLLSLKEEIICHLKTALEILNMGIQKFIIQNIAKFAAVSAVESVLEYVLPVIGSILSMTVTGVMVYTFLRQVIRDLAEDALRRCQMRTETAL